ncbi:MAG: hypothetical protein DRH32_00510 [Deltaproteobacteria bacterium]|nr:MAG: hypothetical protein DRH32_00510 [Deltaproteobacteria bacterium]
MLRTQTNQTREAYALNQSKLSNGLDMMRSMSGTRKVLAGVVLFFLFYTIAGFVVVPLVIRAVLTDRGSTALHREVTIEDVNVNPYTFTVQITGLTVGGRNGEALTAAKEVMINIQMYSLFKRALVVREFVISEPAIHLVRSRTGDLNISDLFSAKKTGPESDPGAFFPFFLQHAEIAKGKIDFVDHARDSRHLFKDIDLDIVFLSSLPQDKTVDTRIRLAGILNGSPVSINGKSRPFDDTLQTVFDVDIKKIRIPHYLPYVTLPPGIKVRSATLDTGISLSYEKTKSAMPRLTLGGRAGLSNTVVCDSQDRLLAAIPMLSLSMAPSEILKKQIHFTRVTLDAPKLNAAVSETGQLNMARLLPEAGPDTSTEKTDKKPAALSLQVDYFRVNAATVTYADASRAAPFTTKLYPLDLTIENFSTNPGENALVTLSMTTESGESLNGRVHCSPAPFASNGMLAFKNISLPKYAPYYEKYIRFSITDGTADFRFDYQYEKKQQTFALSNTRLSLSSVKLTDPENRKNFLTLPALTMDDTRIDISGGVLDMGSLSARDAYLWAGRSAQGEINLTRLFATAEPAENTSPAKTVRKEKPAWQVTLEDLKFENCTVEAEDLMPPDPVCLKLKGITLAAAGLGTQANKRGTVSLDLSVEGQGKLAAHGSVVLNPLEADLEVNADNIRISRFQPYLADKIKLLITDGRFNTAGRVLMTQAGDEKISLAYKGWADLNRFASLDQQMARDFINWGDLHLADLDITVNPTRISLGEISLSDFYTRLIVNADGTLNLSRILGQQEKHAQEKQSGQTPVDMDKDAEVLPIKIGSVTLQGGRISFSDRYIQPNFNAELMELGGRISELSSAAGARADLMVKGRLDNYAPLEITGAINPLSRDLFVDVRIDFSDIEMSPFTPYSGKYLGYTLQKGKLALQLQYELADKKLKGKNRIIFDQLTLGQKVDSPEATSLPVGLAISLLTDRSGKIDVDLPVQGNLDDPEFSLGSIVFKALVNLIAKAITSPFALLSSVFGGGEEISHVEFDYGGSAIGDDQAKKLDTLVQALYDRPALQLEIQGTADSVKDSRKIRRDRFDNLLKAEKLKSMLQQGMAAVSVDDILVTPDEYEALLAKAYEAALFAKPRDEAGNIKSLTADEMEKLLYTNIEVTKDDLNQLAYERTGHVRDFLLKSGRITQDRIFILQPEVIDSDKDSEKQGNRVNFTLK